MRGTYRVQILSGFSRARDFPLALAKQIFGRCQSGTYLGKALCFLIKKIKMKTLPHSAGNSCTVQP